MSVLVNVIVLIVIQECVQHKFMFQPYLYPFQYIYEEDLLHNHAMTTISQMPKYPNWDGFSIEINVGLDSRPQDQTTWLDKIRQSNL